MVFDPHILIPIAHAAEEAAQAAEHTGVAGTLGLSLSSFVAQLINFGIVLFILWKFVFGPVANKLQARTEKIEKAMQDATSIETQKTEFESWKQEAMSKARQEASAIVTAAQTEAGKARETILDQTKEEQQKLVSQAKAQIEQEKTQALKSAKAEIADLVGLATERIIRQKLDEKKDKELIKESLRSIE